MIIMEKLSETVSIGISGPCPEDFINRLQEKGVKVRNYEKSDEFTAFLTLHGSDLPFAEKSAAATQCELSVLSRVGLKPTVTALLCRGKFLLWLIFLIITAYTLQNNIWFIEVRGNETIPEDEILRLLEEYDVSFGTPSKDIDHDQLRNQILGSIPALDYITLNVSGGYADVIVRERNIKSEEVGQIQHKNIVSKTDGVIESVTVISGTAQVSTGDVVTKGQMLISGVTDLERVSVITGAEGEVFARTYNSQSAISDYYVTKKTYTDREKRRFSLSFGKNTINFFKTSGISYDNYDKMMVNKILTLPGGYELPLSVCITVFREYIPEQIKMDIAEIHPLLLQSIHKNTGCFMTAGEILREDLTFVETDTSCLLSGVLECREEIGRSVEIME